MSTKSDLEFKKLMKGLGKFPANIQKNVMTGANRAAAAVIQREARALAPKKTGNLSKSITIRKTRSKGRTDTIHKIALTFGKNSKYNGWYGSFVEFGTAHFAAKPFMRPAMIKKTPASVEASREYLAKRYAKEVAKIKAG